jgi:hypothetical protein
MTALLAAALALTEGSMTDRTFAELDGPLYRYLYLRSATDEQRAEIQRAFLAGNWNAFRAWAELHAPATGGPATPHGRFFADLAAAPPKERGDFVNALVEAQIGVASLGKWRSRPVPKVSDATKRWLVRYLDAFDKPQHAPAPTAVLGEQLVWASHYPNAQLVHLAGDLGLADSLPALERFLAIERRFHKTWTDYGTPYVAFDDLFMESLEAVMKLAGSGKIKVTAASEAIERVRKTLSGPPEQERVWLETRDAELRPQPSEAIPDRVAEEALNARDLGGRTRALWLDAALAALAGKDTKTFAPPKPRVAGALWEVPLDSGMGALRDDLAYHLSSKDGLSIIDVQTGRLHGVADIGLRNEQRVSFYDPAWLVAKNGDVLLVATLHWEQRARWCVRFSSRGTVLGAFPLAHQEDRASAPLGEIPGGIVFARTYTTKDTVWAQGKDGKLLWQHQLAPDQQFARFHDGHVVLAGANTLDLLRASDGVRLWSQPVATWLGEKHGRPQALFAHASGVDLVADFRVVSIGYDGKLRWQARGPGEGEPLSNVVREPHGFLANGFNESFRFDDAGKIVAKVDKLTFSEALSDGATVLLQTGDRVFVWHVGQKEPARLIAADEPSMQRLLALAHGKALIGVSLPSAVSLVQSASQNR